MKNQSVSAQSQTDLDLLRYARDDDIDLSDIPEITEENIARAVIRIKGWVVRQRRAEDGTPADYE